MTNSVAKLGQVYIYLKSESSQKFQKATEIALQANPSNPDI